MAAVQLGPVGQFCLVRGLISLPAIPPGPAAEEIITDIGRAQGRHFQSIAHLFYVSTPWKAVKTGSPQERRYQRV